MLPRYATSGCCVSVTVPRWGMRLSQSESYADLHRESLLSQAKRPQSPGEEAVLDGGVFVKRPHIVGGECGIFRQEGIFETSFVFALL